MKICMLSKLDSRLFQIGFKAKTKQEFLSVNLNQFSKHETHN